MASQKSGPQTRRQPRPGLLRQVQNLKADEQGDQAARGETGLSAAKRNEVDTPTIASAVPTNLWALGQFLGYERFPTRSKAHLHLN